MRYTEEKQEKKLDDLFDLVILILTSVVIAPYRLISEISKKVMYLPYRSLEKLMLTSIVMVTVFIVLDIVVYLFTGRINLVDGSVPLVAKVVVLLIIATISLQFLGKRKVFTADVVEIHEEIEETDEEIIERTVLVEESQPVVEPSMVEGSELEDVQDYGVFEGLGGMYEELHYPSENRREDEPEVIDITEDSLEFETRENPSFEFEDNLGEAQDVLNFGIRSERDLDVPSISEEQKLLLMERIRKVREGGLL